jgi:asparagine synthase (glutamine-hydrolysing)
MCGIVGVIDTEQGHVSPDLLASLARLMVARGPDGQGHFFDGPVGMAMRRLAIIDLAGGWQPFYSRGDQVVAFQNGEIYNHRHLRKMLEKRGHRFVSASDTEVLAHGYAEWGADGLLERLDGMYAIAILDRSRRELHLARDRMGEKPLFYTREGGRFAYASNLLVLASLPWVTLDVSPAALDYYLALHYVPGDDTIFASIRRVLPGERLVIPIDEPEPRRIRYYRPPLDIDEGGADQELGDALVDAVESRLLADVPVGVFLSGGLDSSLVVAIAAAKHRRIATFSMGFDSPAHDESPYAAAVAATVGSDHQHFRFDDAEFRSLLPKVVAVLDEPVGDQALLPVYWLCQEAKRHVTVVLSGEGADEVFGGYSYYDSPAAYGPLRRLVQNPLAMTPSGFPLLLDSASRDRLVSHDRASISPWETELIAWLNRSAEPLRRAAATDLASWLPDDLLVKLDRMTMGHSLEGRAPYLAPSIVAAGLRLPPSRRRNGTQSKAALRHLASRWLPREILDRPKQGFVLPMATWLKQWLTLHGPVQEYFRHRPVPGLDARATAQLVQDDLLRGVQRERLLFALVLFVEWYTSFAARSSDWAAIHRNYYAWAGRESLSRPATLSDGCHGVAPAAAPSGTPALNGRPPPASVPVANGGTGSAGRDEDLRPTAV